MAGMNKDPWAKAQWDVGKERNGYTGPLNILYNRHFYKPTDEIRRGTIIVSSSELANGVSRRPNGVVNWNGKPFAGHVVQVVDYKRGEYITVTESLGDDRSTGPSINKYYKNQKGIGGFYYAQYTDKRKSKYVDPIEPR
ncbi:hypothetical protein [Leptonema illini]|uniref:Uncharacterized protein n=1 Tax=Leptonema illini DSM 21528 TaxID=929563 RepID=H2CB53_9LEPT|nr:hypothetical protein [Leptonema illini]EHQ05193.1 hypothetical protein Lepil_0489 [Leptonema illini DSM 21528]